MSPLDFARAMRPMFRMEQEQRGQQANVMQELVDSHKILEGASLSYPYRKSCRRDPQSM